ncbi:MAG: hypothetical protein L0Y35_03140, partial [Flammeovirgaceae bacterium]|nr:hypothetical protein [Flammeovirgaceae bacterium]
MPKTNKYFLLICLSFFLSGCLGVKHLKNDEKLLYRQSIRAPKGINTDDLDNLYAQKPNRKLFGTPIAPLVGIYYWGKKGYNQEKYVRKKEKIEKKFESKIARTQSQKKINNLRFRKQKKLDKNDSYIENGNLRMQWGEPVAVFDSTVLKTTEDRFKDYLFSKGYFNNHVTTRTLSIGKLTNVTYRIEPGPPFIIDTILYKISDTAVFKLVHQSANGSFVKKGLPYDQENFSKERERIDLLLKDHGYYDFSRQYIEFDVDTSSEGHHKVVAMLIIKDPSNRNNHKQFMIDSINFVADAGVSSPGKERNQRSYRHINFQQFENQYNRKVLSQRVFIAPGNTYSRSNTFATQRQLANLDAFKFVNINYDTSDGHFVANIFTSPLNRYEWTNEFGVNVTQGYPGPFYNVNFKKRNIFRGLENFDLNGRIGFEGVAAATSDQNVYRSTEAGANASITFPQFLWPLKESTRIWLGKYNPKTRVSLGYTFTDRPEYRRAATSFTNTYTWQNKRTTLFSFTLTNLSIINSDIKTDEFQQILNEQQDLGNFSLVNSFKPSFVNSMIFSITWNPNDYGQQGKTSVFIRAQAESGGTIFNFIDTKPVDDQGLQTFKYLRGNVDLRQITPLTKVTSLAFRLNGGVAYSYASSPSLPYEKFFFA